ncbi:MAG: hypothetical protein ACOCRN_00820 [Spirochaetia bacterium]
MVQLAMENGVWLEQLYELLSRLTAGVYTTAEGPFARGGAGKHVRHVLEHYQALLAHHSGTVDYDARERTYAIETDPRAACSYIRDLIGGLDTLIAGDHPAGGGKPLIVRYNADAGSYPVESSLERELMFLSSHTVHHLALVRFILEYLGEEVPDELGVALSTLRYERESGGSTAGNT